MASMFYLLLCYLKKSFHTIFFGFVFPILMLVILVAAYGSEPKAAGIVLPGLIMSAGPVLGIVTLSMTYSDFKQSIIIKRIGATPLKTYQFLASIIIFHVILIFIGSFWILGIGCALYSSQLDLAYVNWGYVILAILLSASISSIIGLIIGILATDFKIANAFALLLYLPTSFLSGQYIPWVVIKGQSVLTIIAKIIPFSYPVSIMNKGWHLYFPGKMPSAFMPMIDNLWLPLIVSLAWIIALGAIAFSAYKYRRK